MQYTIEARELTSESRHRPVDMASRRTTVEADDAAGAIHQFVRDSHAELVSFTEPARSSESIATVKKEDAVYLVRVYTA